MRRSKLYKAQAATFQLDQRYSLDEALALLKAMPTAADLCPSTISQVKA